MIKHSFEPVLRKDEVLVNLLIFLSLINYFCRYTSTENLLHTSFISFHNRVPQNLQRSGRLDKNSDKTGNTVVVSVWKHKLVSPWIFSQKSWSNCNALIIGDILCIKFGCEQRLRWPWKKPFKVPLKKLQGAISAPASVFSPLCIKNRKHRFLQKWIIGFGSFFCFCPSRAGAPAVHRLCWFWPFILN